MEKIARFYSSLFRKFHINPTRIISQPLELKTKLLQAGLSIDVRDYASFILGTSLTISLLFLLITISFSVFFIFPLFLHPPTFLLVLILSSYFSRKQIELLIHSRSKDMDRNLLSALRYIHSKISTGKSMKESLEAVAYSDFGSISSELQIAVHEIMSGEQEHVALSKLIERSPSEKFSMVLSVLIDALSRGIDLKEIIDGTINDLKFQRTIAMSFYKQETNKAAILDIFIGVFVPAVLIFLSSAGSSFALTRIPPYLLVPVLLLILPLFRQFNLTSIAKANPGV